ncbi:MAG: hypothetical protein K9L62_10465 [Vallitaleaceae bacterium]|nr:hypothetical protein [Vallitaleaceae bacterium]
MKHFHGNKIIGIVGTRTRNTSSIRKLIEEKFWEIYKEGDFICSGGCPKGADRFAEQIAKAGGIPILIIYPNYKRFKMGAPTIRNGDIAENSDVVIACVKRPEEGIEEVLKRKKGGTEDMLKKFMKYHPKGQVYLI